MKKKLKNYLQIIENYFVFLRRDKNIKNSYMASITLEYDYCDVNAQKTLEYIKGAIGE